MKKTNNYLVNKRQTLTRIACLFNISISIIREDIVLPDSDFIF